LYASIDLQRLDGSPDEPATIELVNALREDGVLIAASGPTNSSLKIRPPLAITTSQVEMLAKVLTRHITALEV
jgi:4-aminobutyrate aminotransferase-like enzyme